MSLIDYDHYKLSKYVESIQAVASLSALFSDNEIPLLHYRVAENLYSSSFDALNVSRSDITIDAKILDYGVGIKTFIAKDWKNSFQKIAEFNHARKSYQDLSIKEMIKQVAKLRNKRLIFAKNLLDIETFVYHCIIRSTRKLAIYEETMNFIDVDNIIITKNTSNQIYFTDNLNEYKFDRSKSTLYKQFHPKEFIAEFHVHIMENPIEKLVSIADEAETKLLYEEKVIIPLYAFSNNKKIIFEKSGLNQWNAAGRIRHCNEVYIPLNKDVRNEIENFFPGRDESFTVLLPTGKKICMKVCQENGKALMSNPNRDLGEWLLRNVLRLEEREIVTYDMLVDVGIDSVEFTKKNNHYKMNFKEVGSYEKWCELKK